MTRDQTKDQRTETKAETRDQRPETKDQRPKTRDKNPETKDQRPETKYYYIKCSLILNSRKLLGMITVPLDRLAILHYSTVQYI